MWKFKCVKFVFCTNFNFENVTWTTKSILFITFSTQWRIYSAVSGSQVGVAVISCASHIYDPGSSPGLRTWAEICRFQSDAEGFSPGTTVFLPLQSRHCTNPFSPSCIVKFSQLEPILFIEQVWENFSCNLQVYFAWSIFIFSLPNVLFCMCYVRRSWVLITGWDWKG